MKKTVGIATFTGQWPLNYGSALQTTALQWLIKEEGYNAVSTTICLYKPYKSPYSIRRFNNRMKYLGLDWVKTFFLFRFFFVRNRIKLGGHLGEFASDICAFHEAQKYDFLCCGADSIWKGEFIRPFFLWDYDQLSKVPHFSYAASMQAGEFNSNYIDTLKSFLAIGVREEAGKFILQDMVKKDVEAVLDPTLAVDEDKWQRAASKRLISEPYLVCYILDDPEKHYINVKDIAKKHGISRIVFINTDYIDKYSKVFSYYHDADIKNTIGPAQFISLFKYAEITCTDSFHGACFSIIFRHQFYVMERDLITLNVGNDYRMLDLFNRLKIGNRMVKYNQDIDDMPDINWNNVNEALENERNKSITFLKKALEKCEEAYK